MVTSSFNENIHRSSGNTIGGGQGEASLRPAYGQRERFFLHLRYLLHVWPLIIFTWNPVVALSL